MLKKVLKAIAIVLTVLLVVLAGYVAYLELTYSRIADNQELTVSSASGGGTAAQQDAALVTGRSYTALTYNIGFGAYLPEFSFFMDEGVMNDGTETVGDHARALSAEAVHYSTDGVISLVQGLNPDFALLQEVDTDSDRSWHVNQVSDITSAFSQMNSVYAVNLHSSYLVYPPTDPIGFMNSGLLTLSSQTIDSAIRRSYPISEDPIQKLFDLDRCFQVLRLPVEGTDKQLVLINSHMSAYDKGGVSRAKQLEMITSLMKSEFEAGNWVIAGGDWNHALWGSETMYPSDQKMPDWLAVLDQGDLPEGFSIVRADNIWDVPTCRDADIPYEKGVSFCSTIDGFIVSDNVVAAVQNVDSGFAYSDHNPVLMTFKLN